jgi:hypothetical protein
LKSRAGPRFTLLGIGAAASPRFPPAGLVIAHRRCRVAIDGGHGAETKTGIDAWLVTDERAEEMPAIRRAAKALEHQPKVGKFEGPDLLIQPREVIHTSHPTYGYEIHGGGRTVVWAPEFLRFPEWASDSDLMFAEGAGWSRPILFARRVGGHAAALDVAEDAPAYGIRRLVLAHLGRPTLRALDAGETLPFGEIGRVGRTYRP